MANNKLKRGFSNFGFSTILITFVMICIVTFSALALLTADSDYRLSKKVAQKTTAYYKAENKAYKILSEIDTILVRTYQSASDKSQYKSRACAKLNDYNTGHPNLSLSVDSSGIVTYTVPISDTQNLFITLQICIPAESDGHLYKLTGWQTQTTPPEQEETTMHLFGT